MAIWISLQAISTVTAIQHNPQIADGLSGLGTALTTLAAQGVAIKYDAIHMVLGEGNFVLVASVKRCPTAGLLPRGPESGEGHVSSDDLVMRLPQSRCANAPCSFWPGGTTGNIGGPRLWTFQDELHASVFR